MTDDQTKPESTPDVSYDPLAPAAPWSTRQQLALCSAVLNCGNENWNPVSKALRLFAEPDQEAEWCAPKNCAKQYALLLDRSELKRSREYSWGDLPWQELIIKRLTVERLEEAQNAIRKDQEEYRKLKEEIAAIEKGEMDSRVEILWEKAKLDHKLEHYETECCDENNSSNKKSLSPNKYDDKAQIEPSNQTPPPSAEISTKTRRRSQQKPDEAAFKPQQKTWKQLRLDKSANIIKSGNPTNSPTDHQPDNSISNSDVWVIDKTKNSANSPNQHPQGRMTRNSLSSATDFGGIPTLKLQRSPILKRASRRRRRSIEEEDEDEAPNSPGAYSNASSTSATTAMTLSSDSSDATVIANEKEISFSFHINQDFDFEEVQDKSLLEETPREHSPAHPPARTLRSKRSLGDSDSDLQLVWSPRKRRKRISNEVPLTNPTTKSEDCCLQECDDSGMVEEVRKSSDNEEFPLQEPKLNEIDESKESEEEMTSNDSTDDVEYEKQEEDVRMWKRAMLVFLENLMTHKHSTVFCSPVRDEEAVGYSQVVLRPMDLHKLRRRIETCEINTTAELVRDLMLIFTNAIMYNSSQHLVYQMATTMFIDTMDLMECLTVRSIDPYVDPRNYGEDLVNYIIKNKNGNMS